MESFVTQQRLTDKLKAAAFITVVLVKSHNNPVRQMMLFSTLLMRKWRLKANVRISLVVQILQLVAEEEEQGTGHIYLFM